jgi:hypothetical protein
MALPRDAVEAHCLVLASFLLSILYKFIFDRLFGVLTSLLGQPYASILWFSACSLCSLYISFW